MISGKYKHYKGGEYRVLFVAEHTETSENLVVYQSVEDEKIWARPLSMWKEAVEVAGEKVKRFTKIN